MSENKESLFLRFQNAKYNNSERQLHLNQQTDFKGKYIQPYFRRVYTLTRYNSNVWTLTSPGRKKGHC